MGISVIACKFSENTYSIRQEEKACNLQIDSSWSWMQSLIWLSVCCFYFFRQALRPCSECPERIPISVPVSLGAVLFGIAIALLLERYGEPKNIRGSVWTAPLPSIFVGRAFYFYDFFWSLLISRYAEKLSYGVLPSALSNCLPNTAGTMKGKMNQSKDTHLKTIGYILWLFGFTGSHRFYYGKPVTGTIWFFTLGLLGIGWLIDLFLIPAMDREADLKFSVGHINYSLAWGLLTFLGLFGIHRMYLGKWFTGIIYLLTFGIFGFGYLYDLWTLNDQITLVNKGA